MKTRLFGRLVLSLVALVALAAVPMLSQVWFVGGAVINATGSSGASWAWWAAGGVSTTVWIIAAATGPAGWGAGAFVAA
jgi:hypothetical protein